MDEGEKNIQKYVALVTMSKIYIYLILAKQNKSILEY
jgi:hypothetical protein